MIMIIFMVMMTNSNSKPDKRVAKLKSYDNPKVDDLLRYQVIVSSSCVIRGFKRYNELTKR